MRTRETRARARDDETEERERARGLEQAGIELAHELKNPLAAVKALVQLGLRNPAEVASHTRLVVLEEEVTRMEKILLGYLASPRPRGHVAAACVRLGPIVSDTLRALSARADRARVRLSARGDACVEGDPRRLGEALLNLVANGIEATPPGGEVEVEVRPAAEQIEIVVRDTGRGMPPETLRRVGTPFFTTREEGTGLGVALARSVIALHGGSVRYESAPGKGTTVRATLPGVADRRSRAEAPAAFGGLEEEPLP
jgi:signal transduction histidine kinase